MTACDKVEVAAQRTFSPFVEELTTVWHDLNALVQKGPTEPRAVHQRAAKLEDAWRVMDIFVGKERADHLKTLDADGISQEDPEERAARTQLAIGAATVAVNTVAALSAPFLFPLGALGLLYQSRFILGEAYRTVVHERRFGVYANTTVMFLAAALSGSWMALTLGIFSGSFLRWIIAKTESAAQRSVASAFLRHPRTVWLLVGEAEVLIDFKEVQVGSTIIIDAGQMIPVDGVVERGVASVDQQMLTGESRLVEKGPGDSVLASSMLLGGRLYIRVERSGDDTVAAQVAQALMSTRSYKEELSARTEQKLDQMALPMLGLSAVAGSIWGASSALGMFWAVPGYRMMYLGPLTMLSLMHIASRKGILLKDGRALERLREVDTFVLDKTGTLTLERPIAGRVFCFAGLAEEDVLALADAAERGQSHPIALAIDQLARRRAIRPLPVDETQVDVGLGMRVVISGRQVLIGSERLMSLSQVVLGTAAVTCQSEVHELGHSLVFVARERDLVGAIEICPTLRPGAADLVTELHRRGKQVLVLSGDHEAPTRALSTQLGIDRFFAQTLPQDKARLIEELQQQGRRICFVGDGINDSIALQRADVSVSMKGATTIATTVAQVVLMNSNLEQLIELLEMTDKFGDYMRVNRLSTKIPDFFLIGGILCFGWDFMTAIVIQQISFPAAAYSLVKPAIDYKIEEADSVPLHQMR